MQTTLFWNARGACSRTLVQNLKCVCKGSYPSLLILVETKSENESQFHCLQKLGFDELAFVPSVSRSGGLIAVWNSSQISVSILRLERKFIHLRCSPSGLASFLLTAVYSIPSPIFKDYLWQDLKTLSMATSDPWVVIGDFNDILTLRERTGGAAVNCSGIRRFQSRLQDYEKGVVRRMPSFNSQLSIFNARYTKGSTIDSFCVSDFRAFDQSVGYRLEDAADLSEISNFS
ncbi:hypothetical protein K1719_013764 [Acacia pycnantha]|nr:hypothetical protein K1719_013764 [Acacia pycnantha]